MKHNNEQKPIAVPSPGNAANALVMRRYLVGQIITIAVAHYYQRGYGWSNYSEHDYKIIGGNTYHILGESVLDQRELITVKKKNIKDGYMIIRGVKNAA